MAQKIVQENIELVREDGGTYTFKPVKGDYTGRNNYVTFREDFDPVTGDRLIEKSSAAGQVRCTYNASRNESIFEFDYLPDDTRDRPQSQLVYDITSISATDATDVKTPKRGYCKITGDVRNDQNGTDLPQDGQRYIPVLPEEVQNYYTYKNAAYAIGGNRLVVVNSSDQIIYADKNIAGHAAKVLGITTGAVELGARVKIQTNGMMQEPSWSWTLDAAIYLGNNGLLTQVAPTTGFICVVAFPITATSIFIKINPSINL